MAGTALIYLVLGAAGSGRRQLVVDLIDGGLGAGDRPAFIVSENETADERDGALPRLGRWKWDRAAISASIPPDATHVFFVADGRGNPVDQTEAFKRWLDAQGAALTRVLCIVNCRLAERHSQLTAWYEACIHFSDVVLLNRREGVGNKWLSDFLAHFRRQFYPCVFETVKSGRVKNPALVLESQALRMSHVFDEEQDIVVRNSEGRILEAGDEGEGEDLEAGPEEDPYFARRNEGGRRVKEIPEISKYL